MKKLMRILILLLSAVIFVPGSVCGEYFTLKHNSEYWQKELPMGFHDLVRDKDGTVVRAVDNRDIVWFFIRTDTTSLWGFGYYGPMRVRTMFFQWFDRGQSGKDWVLDVREMEYEEGIGNGLSILPEEANAEITQIYLTTKGLLPPIVVKERKKWRKYQEKCRKEFSRYVDKYGCEGEKAGSKKTLQMEKYNNLIKKYPEFEGFIQSCIEKDRFDRAFDEYRGMCGCVADKTDSKKMFCEEKLNGLIKRYPEYDFIRPLIECLEKQCNRETSEICFYPVYYWSPYVQFL